MLDRRIEGGNCSFKTISIEGGCYKVDVEYINISSGDPVFILLNFTRAEKQWLDWEVLNNVYRIANPRCIQNSVLIAFEFLGLQL